MPKRRFTKWLSLRMLSVSMLLMALGVVLLVRIWTLQVTQHEWLGGLAKEQYLKKITLEPMRGAMLDRTGEPLAVSVMTDSVFVMPKEIRARDQIVKELAEALSLETSSVRAKLSNRKHFTWIKRRISPQESAQIKKRNLEGVHLTRESRRYYPARELAASVIGFAGDGRGLEGLELMFDGRLKGSTLLAHGLRDAHGRILFSQSMDVPEHLEGTRLVLTLDLTIQEIVEAELERAVVESKARMGIVIVMDPSTGEILALANSPSFNPNTYWKFDPWRYRNRALTDCFEPGSTMKVFSLASALQSKTIRTNDRIDCEDGRLTIGRHTIHDSSKRHSGKMTPSDVLAYSKNTGVAKIALRQGKKGLFQGLRRFGFGQKTAVDLPGESRCSLRDHSHWSDLELATIAFGQGVSVTALQLASALSAIANGGVWLKPQIVREIRGYDDQNLQTFEADPLGRVVDQRVAKSLQQMMVRVTQPGGTGILGAIRGYRVAGKTGTAQKADPYLGGYSKDKRVASFIGFVPAEKPRIAMVVVIDEPQTSPFGGVVAAPVFARIGEAVLPYLGVFPNTGTRVATNIQRPVQPAADTFQAVREVSQPTHQVGRAMSSKKGLRLPELRGHSVRQALRKLAPLGLEVVIEGWGAVVAMVPNAGQVVKPASKIRLLLERRKKTGTKLASWRQPGSGL